MKKYIFVLNGVELLKKIAVDKRAEGVLFIDENTGCLTFKAYNRKSKKRWRDKIIRYLATRRNTYDQSWREPLRHRSCV